VRENLNLAAGAARALPRRAEHEVVARYQRAPLQIDFDALVPLLLLPVVCYALLHWRTGFGFETASGSTF
jgi:hypothetical protein